MTIDLDKTLNLTTLLAFDQYLDGAVWKLEQLQNGGDCTNPIEASLIWIIVGRISLREKQNLLLARHCSFKRFNGFLTPDE